MKRRFLFVGLLLFLLVFQKCTYSENKQTLILISIDGFRWDYPEKTNTPKLDFFMENGVRAKSLISCFPTKTFPNHYTIVTGMYPQNHGIIANNMVDPELGRFSLGNEEAIHDARWWGGEPIWVTAEKQGRIAACYFWPGSSTKIKGVLPTYFYQYDGDVTNEARIEQILNWLDLPDGERPSFITTYFSLLDDAGHRYGPDSGEVVEAIQTMDFLLGVLLDGLRERELIAETNIMIVSDHGMAELSADRAIFPDDAIDLADVDVVDWNPVFAINPVEGKEEEIYQKLVNAHPNMKVYRKDEIPERYHYRNNSRIPKILAVADGGWSIISHKTFEEKPYFATGGNHGFDNQLQSMGGFFLAHGPAFKSGLVVDPFLNIHLYELMAEILDLDSAANDGSLDSVRVMLR